MLGIYFSIQSGLHVRFCTYFDTGADGDTDGPGVEVPAIVSPAMLLIKRSEPDGQRNQHTFKSHKRSGDSVTEGSDPCGKTRLGCSQPSLCSITGFSIPCHLVGCCWH
jgi:hypothetical protein